MTILDRARGARRIRIDATQLADELARRLPDATDVDAVAWATGAAHDAAGSAREQLDRATDIARDIRRDLVKAGGDLHLDDRIDEVAQRIRSASSPAGLRAIVARLERDLPDTDRDRYDRAYARGWIRARSTYLAVGLVVGVGAGVVAVALLDPKRGKARRERLAARTSSLTQGLSEKVGGAVKDASSRARAAATERGLVEPMADEPVELETPTAPEALVVETETPEGTGDSTQTG